MDSEKITTVCIATCNRPESLRLTLNGLIENFAAYNRTPRILVIDDSSDKEQSARSKELVQVFQDIYAGKIECVDREERLQMAEAVANERKVPKELMIFALLGDKLSNTTIGSVRNTCLLKTRGEKMVMVDDDIVLKMYEPGSIGKTLFTEGNPMDISLLNKDELLPPQFKFVNVDLLAMHEARLGKTSEEILGETNPELQGYRILDTYMGLYGDSPMASHLTLLFTSEFCERVRTMSPAQYENLKNTRYMIQTPTAPTLYQGPLCISMVRGIDTRECPPPFMPVGRAEDLVFGVVRNKAFPLYLSFYIPLLVGHQRPLGTSTAGNLGIYEYTKMNRIISLLIQGVSLVGLDSVDNVYQSGRILSELASQADFASFMEDIRKDALQLVSNNLFELMERNRNMPSFWIEDIQSVLRDLKAADHDKFLIDVTEAPYVRRLELFKNWLLLYGELLQCWNQALAN